MPRVHLPRANATRGASHSHSHSHSHAHVVPLFLPWLAPRACSDAPSSLLTATRHPPSRALRLRYADFAALARPRVRAYSTAPTPAPTPTPAPASAPASAPRHRRRRVPSHHSPLAQRATDSAARRARALQLEQDRLSAYRARQPGVAAPRLLPQGQFRSLRRRIINLRSWHATTLNLSRIDETTDKIVETFAALDRTAYARTATHTRTLTIKHDPRCVRWSAALFKDVAHDDHHQLWRNWMRSGVARRTLHYQRLLVYLLDRKPGRALQFIQVLANDPLLVNTRAKLIADALGHLARLHMRGVYGPKEGWEEVPKTNQQRFAATFLHVFRRTLSKHQVVCSQDMLYSVAILADTPVLKDMFDAMMQSRTHLGFDTLLHYANKFAEAGEFQYALRCLEDIKARNSPASWQAVVDRQRFRWTCALILRKSMSNGQNYHETPGIVASFVKLGVTMDTLLYNVVMHNAMDAGDYTTAFKVYNALEGNGLKPDKHTFSILLHGCTLQSNPAVFHSFAEHCAEVAQQTRDPWLATDYLYYLYVRHQDTPERIQSLLYENYLRFFSPLELESIAKFGSRSLRQAIRQHHAAAGAAAETTTESARETATLAAPPMALYLVLQTEIKAAAAQSPNNIATFYKHFTSAVLAKEQPTLTRLAQNPTIWNAFLFAFCQNQQFASASRVIKDMITHSPPPNVYSWNIFMQAFFKSSQVEAAERVFSMMRDRGTNPDQFSYGVLLRGYAKAQLVDRIGDHMVHLEEDQELNPDLLRALAKVSDRKDLMRVLEHSRKVKEALAKQVEMKAREDMERWKFTPQDDTPASSSPDLIQADLEAPPLPAHSSAAAKEPTPVLPQGGVSKTLPPFNVKDVFLGKTAAKVELEEGKREGEVSRPVPLTIIKGAGHEFIPIPEGESAIVADFHSIQTKTTDTPTYLTSGFYRIQAGPTRNIPQYTYEETKYVLNGQIDVLDEATGVTHHLVAGDFAFFHVGSKAQFSTKSGGTAFFAVTRPVITEHPGLKGREEEVKSKL